MISETSTATNTETSTTNQKTDSQEQVATQSSLKSTQKREGKLFRHSAKDGILVLLTILNLAAIIGAATFFDQLSWPVLTVLGFYFIYMICTNYQCISHNHLHNPFFNSKFLNQLFSVVNSLVLGMSQTLYRVHHLNHHVFNNDFRNPETNETGDWSSLYRWSKKPGVPENIFIYSIMGPLRVDYVTLWKNAHKKNIGMLVWWEHAAMLGFYVSLALINWQFVLFYFLPVFFVGQALALTENYLEHYGADPTSRLTNSVSCYSNFYNWIWFNNGYHQEHHYRPQVHWTVVPEVKSQMLPESERRVVKGSHIGNLFYRP